MDSETRVIAGILPKNVKRINKAQLRLITESNFGTPPLRTLWKHLNSYYDDHLNVIPEWVLKNQLKNGGASSSEILSLVEIYRALCAEEVSEHEFEAALDLLKEEELTRKTEEGLVSAREILKGEYYDDRGNKTLKGQDDARRYLSDLLQNLESSGQESAPEGDMKDDTEELLKMYEYREDNPEEAGGIPYGIPEVDEFTGGARAGDLTLIAGFTGAGKSHAVVSLAWNAMINKRNILMFTTETTREEMEIRVIARHSRLPQFQCPGGIDSHDIMHGTLNPQHKEVFKDSLKDFKDRDSGRLFMVQMPDTGIMDYVFSKANQYNRISPIDLIIIDSINLLRIPGKAENKRVMLEDMLQAFKRFATSFDSGRGVAVVSPWQMSRTAWKEAVEAGGTYTLASLSDTAEAERSASQIITLFKSEDPNENGRLNIQVLKNRGGKEMAKVTYPFDWRNSYIGASSSAAPTPRGSSGNSMNTFVPYIASLMGGK